MPRITKNLLSILHKKHLSGYPKRPQPLQSLSFLLAALPTKGLESSVSPGAAGPPRRWQLPLLLAMSSALR